MIIPIGTDNRLQRPPIANYTIIALNIAVFMITHVLTQDGSKIVETYMLHPRNPQLFQFITYAFLHGDAMHIIGNMLFLYIFGNNVNDRLGNIGYTLLYLGGAVFSGVGHSLPTHASPVLGASGAVAAITGAYLVLLPKTNILVLYVIFFIGTIEVPAIYFISFKLIIYDNILEPRMSNQIANIAYGAHLAGYAFGIVIPLVLLALKMLPHSHYDMWALIDRSRRRHMYKKVVNQGFSPFGADRVPDRVAAKENDEPDDPKTRLIKSMRTDISEAIHSSNLDKAADKFVQLIEVDRQQVLSQQHQLDIANKLMQDGRHQAAADAYESFLEHYRRAYPFSEQIELMLGLIYSRYLNKNEAATKHLTSALERLTDSGQRQMCQDELKRIKGK